MNLKSSCNETNILLEREVVYFYKVIFGEFPPKVIIMEYIKANNLLLHEGERLRLKEIILKKADIEAIEIASRLKFTNNLLTRKIHILMYLSETIPQNFETFISVKNRRVFSLIDLTYNFVRTIYKFLKGMILLKRYKNCLM